MERFPTHVLKLSLGKTYTIKSCSCRKSLVWLQGWIIPTANKTSTKFAAKMKSEKAEFTRRF